MGLIGSILILAIDIYMWIIIIEVVISWLVLFGVFNLSHPKAKQIVALIGKATEPIMKPIRKVIPPISGLDLSPLIAIFALMILKHAVAYVFFSMAY